MNLIRIIELEEIPKNLFNFIDFLPAPHFNCLQMLCRIDCPSYVYPSLKSPKKNREFPK